MNSSSLIIDHEDVSRSRVLDRQYSGRLQTYSKNETLRDWIHPHRGKQLSLFEAWGEVHNGTWLRSLS